jgi:ABC-type transporter Mla subunit MlaD
MAVGNGGQQRSNQQASTSSTGGAAVPQSWDGIKDDVSEIAGAAVDQGREFLSSAREQATGYMDQRKDAVAQSIADFGQSLREACAQFDDRPNIKTMVDNAAQGIDQLADSIRGRSFNELFDEAEYLIRRRPGAVAAATMMAGFLVARFIKSSAESIREVEQQRRRSASKRSPGGQGQQGRRARAQASPGSSYAGA